MKKYIITIPIIILALFGVHILNVKATTATCGQTSNNASSQNNSSDRKVLSACTPASSGTVISGVARVNLDAAGSSVAHLVIYSDNAGEPDALLAVSDDLAITNTTEEAITFTFTGVNQISVVNGTQYWEGIHYTDPGVPSMQVSRANTANLLRSGSDTYSNGSANPCSCAVVSNGAADIYFTYTEDAGVPAVVSDTPRAVLKTGTMILKSGTIIIK